MRKIVWACRHYIQSENPYEELIFVFKDKREAVRVKKEYERRNPGTIFEIFRTLEDDNERS